jgi:glycogen debranching enzyme
MGIEDIRDALIIRERDLFLLTDPSGNVPPGNRQGFGLYHADTRHLSIYDFSFRSAEPVALLSTAELGFAEEQVLTNPRMESEEGRILPRGTIEVRRQRVLADVLEETLRVTNYNVFPVTLELVYRFGADFADIFEVRGQQRERRGRLMEPRGDDCSLTYSYESLDGRTCETRISFSSPPTVLSPEGAILRMTLPRRASATYRLAIAVDGLRERRTTTDRLSLVWRQYQRWAEGCTQVFTNNEFFNKALDRSLADLRMLWSENDRPSASSGHRLERFPAAGTPWFDALFGRDSAIVAMQTLAFRPQIARQCLRVLARKQGRKLDPWRDEEPGKILHELRHDEMSRVGELPYAPYYGSVDATPLFLWLASEYYAWTGDLRLPKELRSSLLAALDWLDTYGDLDGDGYVEYEKRSAKGLVNQGWKDSADSIIHAEGTLARPPVALVEVQGYVYAARRGLASVFDALGEADRAGRLRRQAADLRRRFNRHYWLPDQRFFALALDGENRPCASITSNPGHALWSGIIARDQAPVVAERLLSNDMFSGWGIRTLSTTSPRFNPIGYHLGTVWPHDNAIAAMGLKKYGFEEELNEVATALFDAAITFPYYRLPELFGGEARSAHHAPVPYPVACRPQAWAAGALPMILHAILGLCPQASARQLLIIRPQLPHWLESVQVRGLRVGRGAVDLLFQRRGAQTVVDVLQATGGVRVVRRNRWPL